MSNDKPLDPTPYMGSDLNRYPSEGVQSTRHAAMVWFNPRPEYEQDRSKYAE